MSTSVNKKFATETNLADG